MGKKNISAVISLKDNMTATLRGIKREQKSFSKQLTQTRKEMESISKKQMNVRLNATDAHKAITKLRKDVKFLEAKEKIIKIAVKADSVMNKIQQLKKKVRSSLNSIGKFAFNPVIKLKDQATKGISKVKKSLESIAKGVSIPLAIAGGLGVGMVNGGMELEQQQISMRHFMGVGNKGKSNKELDKMSASYLGDLRNNANATPFETGEVISAGTRALQIAGGDTKNAMQMVKLAEDMAALNPGKTVGDAMEALADMNIGEMARLTEFGVKASSKDDPKAVQKQLEDMYAGGAEKLSTSGSGLLSTITGKLKSNMSDMGQSLLEPLKPVMTNLIDFIDGATPKMLEFGTKIGEGLGTAISFVSENFPKIKEAIEPIMSALGETLGTIVNVIKENFPQIKAIVEPILSSLGSVVMAVIPMIGQAFQLLSPLLMGFLSVAGAVAQGAIVAFQTMATFVVSKLALLSPLFSAVGGALSTMGSIFSTVFSKIQSIVSKAYDFIKPIIDKIGSAISTVTGAVSKVTNFVTGKGKKTDKNATGTRYFSGGLSLVGEHGPELVQMPSGSKVYTNRETSNILGGQSGVNINIASLTVKEEADIEKIAQKLVKKINESRIIYGGAY